MAFETMVPRLHEMLVEFCDHLSRCSFEGATSALVVGESRVQQSLWDSLMSPFLQFIVCEEMYQSMSYLDSSHRRKRDIRETYSKVTSACSSLQVLIDVEVIHKAVKEGIFGHTTSWNDMLKKLSERGEEFSYNRPPQAVPRHSGFSNTVSRAADMSPYVFSSFGHGQVLDIRHQAENLREMLFHLVGFVKTRVRMIEIYTRLQATRRYSTCSLDFPTEEDLSEVEQGCRAVACSTHLRMLGSAAQNEALCLGTCLKVRETIFECRYMDAVILLFLLDSQIAEWVASYPRASPLDLARTHGQPGADKGPQQAIDKDEADLSYAHPPVADGWNWWTGMLNVITSSAGVTQGNPNDGSNVDADNENTPVHHDNSPLPAMRWMKKMQRHCAAKLHLCMDHVRVRALHTSTVTRLDDPSVRAASKTSFSEKQASEQGENLTQNPLTQVVERGLKRIAASTSGVCILLVVPDSTPSGLEVQYGYTCPSTRIELARPMLRPAETRADSPDELRLNSSSASNELKVVALSDYEILQHIPITSWPASTSTLPKSQQDLSSLASAISFPFSNAMKRDPSPLTNDNQDSVGDALEASPLRAAQNLSDTSDDAFPLEDMSIPNPDKDTAEPVRDSTSQPQLGPRKLSIQRSDSDSVSGSRTTAFQEWIPVFFRSVRSINNPLFTTVVVPPRSSSSSKILSVQASAPTPRSTGPPRQQSPSPNAHATPAVEEDGGRGMYTSAQQWKDQCYLISVLLSDLHRKGSISDDVYTYTEDTNVARRCICTPACTVECMRWRWLWTRGDSVNMICRSWWKLLGKRCEMNLCLKA